MTLSFPPMTETWQKLWKVTAGTNTVSLIQCLSYINLPWKKSHHLKHLGEFLISFLCRYLGFKKTILLDRKRLVELLDLHQNGTLTWNEFVFAVRSAHEKRMGQPTRRRVIADKPKEEDYFYANPQECLCERTSCDDLLGPGNSSSVP